MKKRLYRDPGITAAHVDFFDNAVNMPVRQNDEFEDEGAPDDDDRADLSK